MKNLVSRFVKDESGATAIEYGLIAAGISVAIIAVVQGLGSKLNPPSASQTQLAVSNRRIASAKGSGEPAGAFFVLATAHDAHERKIA